MAREIDRIEDWVTYTPDVDDNRTDPDPLTCELHPLSGEEWRAHQRGIVSGKRSGIMARSQKVIGRILAERVRNICGYRVNGRQITTGAELYEYGEPVVYDDIFEALTNLSTLRDGLLGKSTSRSASSPAVTARPGHGVAPGAKAIDPATGSDARETATAKGPLSPLTGRPSSSAAPGPS